MQKIKKYTCRSVWIIILIFSSTLLWAQNEPFHGGSGSGDIYLNTSLTSCNNFRFSGSFGDGNFSLENINTNCGIFRFNGGFGRGDSAAASALLNCTDNRFNGGFGRGDSAAASALLNCTDNRFNGGFGRGDSSINTALTDCNTFIFHGDSADGGASAIYARIRDFLGGDTSAIIICSNETADLFSLYDSVGLTFVWDSPTPMAAGLGTYQLIATTTGGCVDTANATLYQEIIKWTGTVSNDWHNAANWNIGKIPTEKSHVIISGGTPNPCVISNADARAASLQAKTGTGNFSIINNRVLLLSGTCNSLPPGL